VTQRIVLFMIVAGLLVACGGPAQPALAPTPTPTPREIGAAIGRATQSTQSVHFTIGLSGKPVQADSSGLFTLNSMEGDLKRPDSVLAVLSVSSGGAVAEVRTVALAGKQYITNPITRAWSCLASGAAFNPAVLFEPDKGIEFLLQQGFDEISLVGVEQIGGAPHYHLRGTIAGTKLQPISMSLLGSGPVAVDLWADQATMRASKLVLVDTASDQSQPSTWTISFSDYDKTVDVRAPAQC
jgi:lipoprotein LprG